jgi:copper chaperone CopZ
MNLENILAGIEMTDQVTGIKRIHQALKDAGQAECRIEG